ncbi:MAG: hypothetical protein A3J63_01115 [Candidatus Moranbacteria bacterium RIFCSPHIGHO2_02_FULL_40_12b]|nr:MAG: hypothetical protein A3J63_01115 [Candidatus Moranbacteria bacterium RIFCSPHIGHO2_02_FULL_40_12b]
MNNLFSNFAISTKGLPTRFKSFKQEEIETMDGEKKQAILIGWVDPSGKREGFFSWSEEKKGWEYEGEKLF